MRQREEAADARSASAVMSAATAAVTGARRLPALREALARMAIGSQSLLSYSDSLHDHFQQKAEPVPLGTGCRFDRLLGGGLRPGTLTEILARRPGDGAAAAGFLLALAARLAARRKNPAIIWIGEDFAAREHGALYGPGLALFGLDPARLVLVAAASAQQALWAMEEALKCGAPAVVIGELWSGKPYDLTASRRLLLAAQKHGTPALLLLSGSPGAAESLSSGADLRFEVQAQASRRPPAAGSLPLPGAACWSVRIAKARLSAPMTTRIQARAGPGGFDIPRDIDRDTFHTLIWDHDEASFRDALPFALAPASADRPDRPAVAQK